MATYCTASANGFSYHNLMGNAQNLHKIIKSFHIAVTYCNTLQHHAFDMVGILRNGSSSLILNIILGLLNNPVMNRLHLLPVAHGVIANLLRHGEDLKLCQRLGRRGIQAVGAPSFLNSEVQVMAPKGGGIHSVGLQHIRIILGILLRIQIFPIFSKA